MHQKIASFQTASSAKVAAVALEKQVERLVRNREVGKRLRTFPPAVHSDEECATQIWMKRDSFPIQPEDVANRWLGKPNNLRKRAREKMGKPFKVSDQLLQGGRCRKDWRTWR